MTTAKSHKRKKVAKKVTRTTKAKVKTSKWSSISKNLINTRSKRIILALAIVLFAFLGTKILIKPFAEEPYGVTRAGNELAVQLIEAHSHAHPIDEPSYFEVPHFMLYSDGLLLCGEHDQSPKKGYGLASGKLTISQVDKVVEQITKLQPNGDEEKKHTIQSSHDWPIEAVDQVLVNYNRGAVEMRGNETDHTPRFTAVKALLNATCKKYATSPYDPEKYALRTQPATEESVSTLDEVDTSIATTKADEPFVQSIIGRDEAAAIKQINQGNNYAKIHSDGRVFALELVPIIPEYNPITPSDPADKDKVEAASYLPSRWYWFYPSDKGLSSLNTLASGVSSQARAFYKQETGRDNSAASVVIIHGAQTDYWYKNHCPASGCSSDKDLNATINIRDELRANTTVNLPNTSAGEAFAASYNILYQGPSYRGSNICYGYAMQPASVSGSRGEMAISFGYTSSSTGCGASSTLRYAVASHEMGHTLGLGHYCSDTAVYIMCPTIKITTWPSGYNTTTTQASQLKAYSLLLNHLVYGRVVYSGGSTGVANIKITSCNTLDPDTVTNSTGYFSFRFPTRSGYCLRMTAPAGYKISTQNNPEHSTAASYESNLAGYNCYKQPVSTSCNSNQVTWDMASDLGKNFILTKL
jgi:hypothetical protein